MKNLFRLDNPVFQFLTRIADLVVLHFLTLLCCLPLVTAGAAFTALAKCTQAMTQDEIGSIPRTFFGAFRANFKQSTVVWLCGAVALAAIASDYLLMRYFIAGPLFTALCVVLLVLLFMVLAVLAYIFPLIARYDNTLKEHLQNAMILTIYKLPKTIVMVLVHGAPAIFLFFFPDVLVYTMPFWVFMGFGFSSQVDSMLLRKVFQELEAGRA